MARERIALQDDGKTLLLKMAEGNPGAITVLVALLKTTEGPLDVLHLDDMNIRGEQIWLAYKDHCDQDIERLRRAIRERDASMVITVNENSSCGELAVASGASYERA